MAQQVTILGAGMAGYGAAHCLQEAGKRSIMFDKNPYHGGHTASFRRDGGWIFDEGPHVSFTRVERMQKLFAESVRQEYAIIQTTVNNYWLGHWIKHPAQCNLHGLPTELVVKILADFVAAGKSEAGPIRNYADWLVASFGQTFAETFPMQYGHKYHTTTANNMSTDWLGPRLYRPTLEEMLRGALTPKTPDVHYIDHFRYPSHGGFVSYLNMFLDSTELHLKHELVRLDVDKKELHFSNGTIAAYDSLISSIPLPALVKLIPQAPREVREAAGRLAWTTVVIVNVGIARSDISSAHWSYFYDDDFVFTRLSFPHMLSPHTVPPGMGSVQAELYFSEKYRPLTQAPEHFIPQVIGDLKRCGLLREDDKVLFSEAMLSWWAQVIFDLDRSSALSTVHGYLKDVGIAFCGRYGDWGYLWTDESFMSGERAAEEVLGKIGPASKSRP